MKRSLIYLDSESIKNSLELLEVARQIYSGREYETYGIGVNLTFDEIYGKFNFIINIMDEKVKKYDQVAITDIMEQVHGQYNFDSVIIPATQFGRMLAPRLAMRLRVGLVADITDVKYNNGNLELIRPAFSGRIMAGIVTNERKPIMMSVRQNVFSHQCNISKQTKIINYKPSNYRNGQIKLLKTRKKEESYDIRESKILVSGGGGTLKNFDKLNLLAKELGGQVSASRKIVDSNKASRSIQVGQSGKTVSPNLYIALGISGAIEHIEGLKNVEHIISVNINKNAPICSLSDIVVEGDAIEFVRKLTEKIKKNKKN
jgi:electron transfer flavoprotein alpha subunit